MRLGMRLRTIFTAAALIAFFAAAPIAARAEHGPGDYDDHHVWHDDGWWHANHPDWVTEHHPDWVRNHPDWRTGPEARDDGDWDDHHRWRNRGWWWKHHPEWVREHHPHWTEAHGH